MALALTDHIPDREGVIGLEEMVVSLEAIMRSHCSTAKGVFVEDFTECDYL